MLRPERLRWLRRLWNLQQWLRTRRLGGFQYSNCFTQPVEDRRAWLLHQRASVAVAESLPIAAAIPMATELGGQLLYRATTRQVFIDYGAGTRIAQV